jgi:hypothetical protein
MIKFKTYIEESKNTHMEHLEDNVLNGGVKGARQSINFLRQLRDTLSGDSREAVNATVKWDGAPAIFVGNDPSDGKFFVAKKGIFNKNPKVYKTKADVDADTSGDLADKLNMALTMLSGMKIDGVVQGDFLFSSSDLKSQTIDGETYVVFHPNTIAYAVPMKSALGRKILNSKMGVVWHTMYKGNSFETMRASFGVDVNKFGKIPGVWQIDAGYEDVSGSATMTKAETVEVTKHLALAGKSFNKIKAANLNFIADNEELLDRMKVYHNSRIRERQEIKNPMAHAKGMVQYMMAYEKKELAKRSTERGKKGFSDKFAPIKKFVANTPIQQIAAIYELMMHLVHTKKLIIDKMNRAAKLKTFLKTRKGFIITSEEGYVAIDKMSGNAVKLVDRLEFSYANFSPDIIKGWQSDTRK